MNILIITLGTSDVQIKINGMEDFIIENGLLLSQGVPSINLRQNRNYGDYYLLGSPRRDGELILDNFDSFRKVLQFPLIDPLLEMFDKYGKTFQEVWWVFTDQKNERSHFKDNDTLYFKSIIQKDFQSRFPELRFQEFAIHEQVQNIDFQYRSFYNISTALSARKTEINEIFLLPQGGIDQINHALTLQLIQVFKEKVKIFQKAELSEPVQLEFTNLFLNDLTKHKVIKHLLDYDFDKAGLLIFDNPDLERLAKYAALRLTLRHDYINPEFRGVCDLNWDSKTDFDKNRIKLQDLVYSFKIEMKQEHYNDALIKFFTISENMFKIGLDEYCQENTFLYYNSKLMLCSDENEKWKVFIETKFSPDYFLKLKEKKINLNNPNGLAISYIYRWLIEEGKIRSDLTGEDIKALNTVANDLREIRNKIAHKLGSISGAKLQAVLDKRKMSFKKFYELLDSICHTSGFGIYDDIQRKILEHYGEHD